MIAGVYSEAEHLKRDLDRAVRALTTDAAVGILRRAFEDAGVLPSAVGGLAGSLADALMAEPAESFESLRFRGACELALERLDQEHRRRGRRASWLRRVLMLCVLATIALAVSAFVWRDAVLEIGVAAAWGSMASVAIGFWYRHASRLAERVREDRRELAKVEFRRP